MGKRHGIQGDIGRRSWARGPPLKMSGKGMHESAGPGWAHSQQEVPFLARTEELMFPLLNPYSPGTPSLPSLVSVEVTFYAI